MQLDTQLTLLGDARRRRVVADLSDGGSRTVEECVRVVDDGDPDALRTALHHVHLPKLADEGVIDWDVETGTVRRGPRFDELEPLVELLRSNQDVLPDSGF